MIFYYEAPVILLNIFCKRKAKKELTTKQILIMFLRSFLATYASKDVTVREKLQEVSKKPLFLQCLQASLEDKIQTTAQVGAKVWGLLKFYISAMHHIEKKHLCFIIFADVLIPWSKGQVPFTPHFSLFLSCENPDLHSTFASSLKEGQAIQMKVSVLETSTCQYIMIPCW